MGIFDGLGLGGVFGGSYPAPPVYNQQQIMGYAQLQQQYQQVYLCKHGADCPMCFEIAKKQGEKIKKREEIKTQKKLEYENRCKIYMDKFNQGGHK